MIIQNIARDRVDIRGPRGAGKRDAMTNRLPMIASALIVAAGLVSGCAEVRDAAGLAKKSPDEFQVMARPPLSLPPNFTLTPPTPGRHVRKAAAPTSKRRPKSSAARLKTRRQNPRRPIYRPARARSIAPSPWARPQTIFVGSSTRKPPALFMRSAI